VAGNDSLASLRAELLADNQGIPIVAIRDGRVQASNAAAHGLFARVQVGTAIGELFDESCQDKLLHFLRKGISGGTPELQVKRLHGPPVAIRFLLLSVSDEQLLVAQDAGFGYSQDLEAKLMAANSHLANLTRELSRQMRALDSANQQLQKFADLRELFIAALAHDLKTPLSVILLSEAKLRGGAPASKAVETEHVNKVERSAKRMLALIDSLLLAARLEASDSSLPSNWAEPVRFDEIARKVADDLAPVADDARVRVVVTANEPVWLRGNSSWLAQVLTNLLTNAIRHSPSGARVDVGVAIAGREALCEVADRGPGVPFADREQIFDRFVQREGRRGSVGLGLYICRKIVQLHGGRIWVEDNPGGGARFAFRIPGVSGGP
jgi:signal transduction histidine kinase